MIIYPRASATPAPASASSRVRGRCRENLRDYSAPLVVNLLKVNIMSTKLKCILCVEDEPEMIDLMRLILGRQGFEVKGASGWCGGVKVIRDESPILCCLT